MGESWRLQGVHKWMAYPPHAHWLEIGWALRGAFWGHGYAAEIGHAGLVFAFDVRGVNAVVSCCDESGTKQRQGPLTSA